MRVQAEERFVDLLQVAGVDTDRVPTLLELIAADVSRLGFYDMQYRPFLRVQPSTLRIGDEVHATPSEVI